jgi:hypothetical protein
MLMITQYVRDFFAEAGRRHDIRGFSYKASPKAWTAKSIYGKLYKHYIDDIVKTMNPDAVSGSTDYLTLYWATHEKGFSRLSKEDVEKLEETAERYNKTGPPVSWKKK